MPLSLTSARRLRAATALAVLTVPVGSAGAALPSPTPTSAGFRQALGLPGAGAGSLTPQAAPPSPAEQHEAKHDRVVSAHAARTQRTIRQMEQAGKRIATRPYTWGGGHGSFQSAGYDCSGSVSYVLHAAGLLDIPMASGALGTYGDAGRGKHVTIYANAGHVFMVIDGRRFDTIAFKQTGTRWSDSVGSTSGYVVRHPHGL